MSVVVRVQAHFSRFIPRGSKVLSLETTTDTNSTFMATAVLTPDSDIVIVCLNTDGSSSVHYQVQVGGEYTMYSIPPRSIQTLTVGSKIPQSLLR